MEAIHLASREIPFEDPPARVWANIRAALAEEGTLSEPVPRWQRWFRYVGVLPDPAPIASVAALAILGILLLVHSRVFQSNLTSNPPKLVAEAASAADYVSDDAKLTHTLEEMEKSYWAREKSLDPSVQVIYQKSLRSLDNSINECRASVRRQPADDLAQQYLLTAYAQKAEVLTSALEFGSR
jgi:hypothetical protein